MRSHGDVFYHAECGISMDEERHAARAALRAKGQHASSADAASDGATQSFRAPLDYIVVHSGYVVVRSRPTRASPELCRKEKGDIVSANAQSNGWLRLDTAEGGWMLIDASAMGLGVLLSRHEVSVDVAARLRYIRAGSPDGATAWGEPTQADASMVVEHFAPGRRVSLVATCGGWGKCWVDVPLERACSASVRAGWVLLSALTAEADVAISENGRWAGKHVALS